MNRIYISLRDIPTTRLQLGFEGENDHTQVVFDSTALYISYPSAVASMTVKSPSGVLYPKELVKSGNRLIWNISASDCARAGSGQYQLTFTSGTEVIKTYIGSFSVDSSLLGSGDPPDPVEDWLQEAQEALDAFEQDVSDAEAWAVGTRDGDPVGSTDPAYHNNSKYYAEQAEAIEQTIETTGATQVAAIEAKGEEVLESIPSDYTALSEDVDELYAIKAPAIISTASGSIASFADGADGMPLRSLSVAIEPVQEGEGDPSPDNVRPITGWDGVKVTRTGKNLFSLDLYTDANWTPYSDPEIAAMDGYYGNKRKFCGMNNPDSDLNKYGIFKRFMPLGRVTISFYNHKEGNWRVYFHYVGESNWDNYSGNITAIGFYEFTSPANKICDGVKLYTSQGESATGILSQLQIEINTDATSYESPKNNSVCEIEFPSEPGTVYGGTLDVTTGVLTVDRLKKQVLSTDVANESSAVAHRYYTNNNYVTGVAPHTTMLLCDAFKVTGQSTKVGEAYISGIRQAVFNTNFSTLSEFKSWIDTNGLSFIYKLATPLTYTLTAAQVTTLLGTNNIWADTGNVSLEYPADTRLFIEKKISELQALILENISNS